MGNRSITEAEIALIRRMTERNMKNKDIQFLFNRPDRAVNSGRISEIRDKKYGQHVPAATDAEVDAFILSRSSAALQPSISVFVTPPSEPISPPGPLDHNRIRALFEQDEFGVFRLTGGETNMHECKLNFGLKQSHTWVRAIAALANNHGGYIFFGVHDLDTAGKAAANKSHAAIGMTGEAFQKADPAEVTRQIKGVLDPTPTVGTTHLTIGAAIIGVMHVEQHPSRPVIVRSGDGNTLKEGDIFYRYPGRSERIKYSDLRTILDERDKVARTEIMPLIERLLALGPSRALIADLELGKLQDGKQAIMIDPALLDQIKFIREGEFSEKEGAPALRLIGNVTADGTTVGPTRIVRANVTSDAVLRNFLQGEPVHEPWQYVQHAAHSNREWLPIWYYILAAGVSVDDAIERLKSEPASMPSHRDGAVAQLKGSRNAYKAHGGKPKQLIENFKMGIIAEPPTDSDAHKFALAVQGLPEGVDDLIRFRDLLLLCYERANTGSPRQKNLHSAIFRAACRLDELFYKPKVTKNV